MKRTFIKSTIALALYFALPAAYSAPVWYYTFGAGMARPVINTSTLVDNNSGAISPFNNDIYTSNKGNNAAFLLEIGKRWTISDTRLKALSLGLQYQHFFPTDIGHQITQYSSPQFLNYSYDLDLSANILMLNAKVDLFSWKKITPFINVGGGILQLTASGYGETAYSGITARTSPAFQRNENYQLTYQAGAGFSWELNPSSFVSINYLYMPLTKFATKGGAGPWSNRKLDFGDKYAQSIFITFTHN